MIIKTFDFENNGWSYFSTHHLDQGTHPREKAQSLTDQLNMANIRSCNYTNPAGQEKRVVSLSFMCSSGVTYHLLAEPTYTYLLNEDGKTIDRI